MESFAVDPKSFVILSLRFQFNLMVALASLPWPPYLTNPCLSYTVNHTFLYLYPRDR